MKSSVMEKWYLVEILFSDNLGSGYRHVFVKASDPECAKRIGEDRCYKKAPIGTAFNFFASNATLATKEDWGKRYDLESKVYNN